MSPWLETWGNLLAQAGIIAAFIGAGTYGMLRMRRQRAQAWQAIAAGAGLEGVAIAHHLFSDELTGRWGAFDVRFTRRFGMEIARRTVSEQMGWVTKGAKFTLLTIEGLPSGLGLAPEKWGLLSGQSSQREFQVGDPAFDSAVYVQGPRALLFALLDWPTRVQLIQAMQWPAVVAGGALTLQVPLAYAGGADNPLPTMLRLALRLAERLQRPPDLVERLAANVRGEPLCEVRLGTLRTLGREYPEHAATRDALRHALADSGDEVRLRAALMLGPEGLPVLREMALRERGEETWTAWAVEALGALLGGETVHALLARALRERRHLLARAAMSALARVGDAEALRTLSRILALEKGDLAEAAAVALGGSNRAAAEAPLVAALDHTADFVRQAAAQALGRVGSIAAVLPLREAEQGRPGDAALSRAARESVAAIQARHGGATPGQVSLAGQESGQLSLPAGEPGRISLPEEPW